MKATILKSLKDTDGYVSGQRLCEQLGVSRTAVWKVIAQLKEEGYEIESVRNKGYRLISAPDLFSASEIESRLKTKKIARKVLYFDKLNSTNTYCRKYGEELPDGTLVIADVQTAGRGSRGRGWESPRGESIYMTLLLKPSIVPANAPCLTLVMALSVARALRENGVDAKIKWPNDIVAGGKKVVGILTEMNAEVDYIHQLMIGVGINVLTEQFPEELKERATSLLLATGRRLSRSKLVADTMQCFEEDYEKFLRMGDLSELLEQYEQFSATLGSQVKVLDPKGAYTAQAIAVDQKGRLLVEKQNGERILVFADEVSVRGLYGYV